MELRASTTAAIVISSGRNPASRKRPQTFAARSGATFASENNRTTVAGKMAPDEWADLRQQVRADEGFVAVLPGTNFDRFHGSEQKWEGSSEQGTG